jgi:hypothetical protein
MPVVESSLSTTIQFSASSIVNVSPLRMVLSGAGLGLSLIDKCDKPVEGFVVAERNNRTVKYHAYNHPIHGKWKMNSG